MVYTVLYCMYKNILYLNINDPRQYLDNAKLKLNIPWFRTLYRKHDREIINDLGHWKSIFPFTKKKK